MNSELEQPQQRTDWLKKLPRWAQLLIIALLALSAIASGISYINSIVHDPVPDLADQYYTAIEHRDYATAYGFLAPSIETIPGGEPITQAMFTQQAQDVDRTKGRVKSFSIANIAPSDIPHARTFTITVTRNGAPYEVNLDFQKQLGGDWKIIRYDGI